MRWWVSPMVIALSATSAIAATTQETLEPILKQVGATVKVWDRPAWPKPPGPAIEVTLSPQADKLGKCIVSFGLPFGPDVLRDDKLIRVLGADGKEIPAFTQPLANWLIDGKKGTPRSVLVQFEGAFPDRKPQKVTLRYDRPRMASRAMTPIAQTQDVTKVDGWDFHAPKVLALLPPDWLCASLIAWQQVPAAQSDKIAPWFDKNLLEQFPGSLKYISARTSEPHLYDRPATYTKIYLRHGKEEHLLAAMKAADFYIQNLKPDGFFRYKPGDNKYVYTEGPALMYLLTGDPRYQASMTLALKSWALWKNIDYNGKGFWTERHMGFGLAAYLHAYELSGDPAQLATARKFFESVFRLQCQPLDGKPPDGAWDHTSDSHGDGNGWTTSPWMSALLMDSIWQYWMLTGDPRCPASLGMYAKFADKYAITDDGRMFYMANSPGRGRSSNAESPPHHVEGCYILGMGYYLSGGTESGMLKKINTLYPLVGDDGANRPPRKFSWRFRETSMLIWFLRETKAAPPPPDTAAPPAKGPTPLEVEEKEE